MKIGTLMQACRERAGLSQEQMAVRLHRTQSYVSKVEKGRQEPDFETVVNWTKETDAEEVVVAYLYRVEGIKIIQHLMSQQAIQREVSI